MSSSKLHKPAKQEYIAKVRYSNNLPPPPLNPKFLQYGLTENVLPALQAQQLMSSLFRKENFLSFMENIDLDLGMPLNLIANPAYLDDENVLSIHALPANSKPIQLHPRDRALLRDAGIENIARLEPGVSFLRRTEYIAERLLPKASGMGATAEAQVASPNEEKADAAAQLAVVESTFEKAQHSLSNFAALTHPRKRHLKAVDAWPLLPDTSMLDAKFFGVKFVGSALVQREQRDKPDDPTLQKAALETALLKPTTSQDGEWLAMYQCKDMTKTESLKLRLNSTEKEQPADLLDPSNDSTPTDQNYRFKHIKSYEMNFSRFEKSNEELLIKFVSAGESLKKRKAAYYYPISGRIFLKKYRASTNSEVNRFLKERTADVIDFTLREPTSAELRKRDLARSEFDPMEYEGDDDDDEEEEENGEANGRSHPRDIADEFDEAAVGA